MRRFASRFLVIALLAFIVAIARPVNVLALGIRQATNGEHAPDSEPRVHSYAEQLGLSSSTAAASGVRPDQTYSDWSWPGDAYYTNTVQRLTIEPTTTPGGHYFWYYQFWFADLGSGSDGGYLGLQDGDTKIVLFSIWNANKHDGVNCGTFDHEGFGHTCRIDPYEWQPDREYRLRVQQDGSEAGGTWWKATVLDTVTLVQQTVGRIRVPLAWGNVHGVSSVTEYWGDQVEPVPTCADLPRARVRFKFPVANNGTVNISSHTHSFQRWDCRSAFDPPDVAEPHSADRHIAPK